MRLPDFLVKSLLLFSINVDFRIARNSSLVKGIFRGGLRASCYCIVGCVFLRKIDLLHFVMFIEKYLTKNSIKIIFSRIDDSKELQGMA